MKFYGVNDQEFMLEIVNLEFPLKPIKNDWVDPDFLIIHFIIKSNFGNFEHKSPLLEIMEVKGLIKWLQKLSKCRCKEKKWGYTLENFIEFELINSEFDIIKQIKIYFWEDRKYFIEAHMNNLQLKDYANQLNDELQTIYKVFSVRKTLRKILKKGMETKNERIIVEENADIYIKNNFVDKYDLKNGYKIIYTKLFLDDLEKIKNNVIAKKAVNEIIEKIKKYPFDNPKTTTEGSFHYADYSNLKYKIADEFILFYQSWLYEEVVFIRLLYNTNNYKRYFEYLKK